MVVVDCLQELLLSSSLPSVSCILVLFLPVRQNKYFLLFIKIIRKTDRLKYNRKQANANKKKKTA